MIDKLLPCPFCGDTMQDRGYGAVHVGNEKCPIYTYAIDSGRWNKRAHGGSSHGYEGWFVKDFADGWIFFDSEADAFRQAEATGAAILVGHAPYNPVVDQQTIDRVASALRTADIAHSMKLIRLADGVHTYTLTIRGEVETFVDNDEADAIDQIYTRIREVKHRLQAEAVIATLRAKLSQEKNT